MNRVASLVSWEIPIHWLIGDEMRRALAVLLLAPTVHALAARPSGRVARRRELLSVGAQTGANTAYKSFAKAGGGEATLAVIAACTAYYGGLQRDGRNARLAELEASAPRTKEHAASVVISPTQAIGSVSVEVSIPAAPGAAEPAPGDRVDYIWLKDAASGQIVAARGFKPGDPLVLTSLVSKGSRVVPLVHSERDGVWVGEPIIGAVQ